jgi:hypothetical protein
MPLRARDLLRPAALWFTLGLAQFGGLALAAHFYPANYNWRHDVISRLSEPRFNPHAHWIAALSLALTGLFLLPFPRLLAARLGPFSPRLTKWAGRFLYLGASLLILAAAIPGHAPSLGRTHEDLAEAFGAAISLAMIFYFAAAQRLPRRLILQRHAGLALIVIPFSAFVASRIDLIIESGHTSAAEFHTLKNTGWTSLALWEWIAAAGTYLFLGLLTLGLSAGARSSAR